MPRPRPPLPAGPYLVVGLARSGSAAALALRARGFEVVGVDGGNPADGGRLARAGVEVLTHDPGIESVARAAAVVKSPGVPREAAAIVAARARGIPVLGELELAWRMLSNEFVAVTGTNGKTTTTELLGHLHREAGLPVAVAGNVGTALASLEGTLAPGVTVIAEASSFQLEDTLEFAPEAAALRNLAPDHLDRHGDMAGYTAAKLQVFARQGNDDVAVHPCGIGIEDLGGCARRICFGDGPDAELADRAGQLWWADEPLIRVDEIRLRGLHNRQNAMAAAALALARGMAPEAVRDGLASFVGVEHRLEEIDVVDGIAYVNDSKATNVASTEVALASFAGGVHLILGGQAKSQSFSGLRDTIAQKCEAVYLIGQDAPIIYADLDGLAVSLHDYGDLERAVSSAREAARAGEVVLLSPACASFDQYTDFEARGEHFRTLVAGDR